MEGLQEWLELALTEEKELHLHEVLGFNHNSRM